jgi:hypothetical protein
MRGGASTGGGGGKAAVAGSSLSLSHHSHPLDAHSYPLDVQVEAGSPLQAHEDQPRALQTGEQPLSMHHYMT